MNEIISSNHTEFIEGSFEGKAERLREKYDTFDFVWFDWRGLTEYKKSWMNIEVSFQTTFSITLLTATEAQRITLYNYEQYDS